MSGYLNQESSIEIQMRVCMICVIFLFDCKELPNCYYCAVDSVSYF